MALLTTNIMVGAATVSVGAWVTAGGGGSLTDVGHTKGPTTLSGTFEDYRVTSEQALGALKKIPQDAQYKLKIPMLEATGEHLRQLTRQAAGALTGTPPDMLLLVGNPLEQYHQITVVGPGPGTLGVRTLTFWRCIVESISEIPYGKGAEQLMEATFDVMYDDSLATADKFFKQIDT